MYFNVVTFDSVSSLTDITTVAGVYCFVLVAIYSDLSYVVYVSASYDVASDSSLFVAAVTADSFASSVTYFTNVVTFTFTASSLGVADFFWFSDVISVVTFYSAVDSIYGVADVATDYSVAYLYFIVVVVCFTDVADVSTYASDANVADFSGFVGSVSGASFTADFC